MHDKLPLPSTSGLIATEVISATERRSAPRTDCHTVVTAVSPQGEVNGAPLQVVKARSEDISVSGARLISSEPLPSQRLYLRFLLPMFGDRYVEAEVVNETIRDKFALTGQVTKQYVYGVRFLAVKTGGEVRDERGSSPAKPETAHVEARE